MKHYQVTLNAVLIFMVIVMVIGSYDGGRRTRSF